MPARQVRYLLRHGPILLKSLYHILATSDVNNLTCRLKQGVDHYHVEAVGIEPTTTPLAKRVRYLTCRPQARRLVLTSPTP
jgi:hypothetical protein